MSKEIILTDKAPQPIGPYSQAVKVGNMLFISGQIGLTPEGEYRSASIEAETTQVMDNLEGILQAAGMSLGDLIKTSIFLSDMNNFSRVNQVYGSFFEDNPPARETMEVAQLPKGVNVEISAIAVGG